MFMLMVNILCYIFVIIKWKTKEERFWIQYQPIRETPSNYLLNLMSFVRVRSSQTREIQQNSALPM